MPLNTQHTPEDEAPLLDGDDAFYGVIDRGDPAALPPGYVPHAVNMRFREAVAEPRLGTVRLPWFNKISGTNVQAWSSQEGAGKYRDTARRVWDLLAVEGGVQACLPNNAPRSVPLPAGETITARAQFLQLGSRVLLLRGDDADPLMMENLNTGFVPVPDPVISALDRVPRARRGVIAGDRVWLITAEDEIWASDLFDFTSWHPLNQFIVGDGAEAVVQIALFGDTNLIVFKRRSIWRLTDILTADADGILACTAPNITRRFGCVAADSVVDVGADMLWLCEEGIASLTLTQLGAVQVGEGQKRQPMFSDDIQNTIRRIRFDYAENAQGAFWDGKFYMAVPLDDAEALGLELSPIGFSTAASNFIIPVTAGHTYRWVKTSVETNLVNGTETIAVSTDFTAQGSSVLVNFSGVTVACSLKEVRRGINNAVLVYDFKALRPAWQGYDQGEGIEVRLWFQSEYNRRNRLMLLGGHGWSFLYEEGYEAQLVLPYTDVTLTVDEVGDAGDTFRVNGGATLTTSGTQDATHWNVGAAGPISAADNLFTDGNYGYYAGSTITVWSAPNTIAVKLGDNAVRFYGTNGAPPTILRTGVLTGLVLVESRFWAAVETELLTRGYSTPARLERKSARKLQALLETWDPQYSIALKSDGVSEETEFVSAQTRSRTIYDRPFDRAPWNAANASNDFPEPFRQDYSLNLGTPFKLGDGLGLGLHQAAEHTMPVRGRSSAHQARLRNTLGRVRVLGVGYEGRRRERGHGIKV